MITKKLLIGSALAAFILVGCGGGGSSTSASTGYLVDSAVANADYDCIADGTYNKKTGPDGSFTCTNMSQVRFRVGNLVLGEIHALPADQHVFPQDLVGVPRDSGLNDAKVIAMAQLLQSIDSDHNPENGIAIAQETKNVIVETETSFNPSEVPVYLNAASAPVRTTEQARLHLQSSMYNVEQATQTAQDTAQTTAQTAQGTAQTTAQTAQGIAQTTVQTAQDAAQTAINLR